MTIGTDRSSTSNNQMQHRCSMQRQLSGTICWQIFTVATFARIPALTDDNFCRVGEDCGAIGCSAARISSTFSRYFYKPYAPRPELLLPQWSNDTVFFISTNILFPTHYAFSRLMRQIERSGMLGEVCVDGVCTCVDAACWSAGRVSNERFAGFYSTLGWYGK